MPDAFIIDACRTPRGIGKQGKVPKHRKLFSTIFQTFMSGPYILDYFDVKSKLWVLPPASIVMVSSVASLYFGGMY